MTKVLVIDPGERVGWAHGTIKSDAPEFPFKLEVTGHGISTLKDFALKLHEAIDGYDVVVYETWRLRADKAKTFIGSEFPSVQFVGMVRLCAWLNPGVKLVSQGPSVMATADKVIPAHYPDIANRLAKMPKAHDESHDGSALRHLAYYHFKNYMGV